MRASTALRHDFISGGALRRLLFVPIGVITALLCQLFIFSVPAKASTNVTGTISSNTEWTTAGSPYVTNGITIAQGATLTIDAGVVVKFTQYNSSLTVNGTLNATGAFFTSYKDDANGGDTNGDGNATQPAPGDWRNIDFESGSGGTLSGCSILYGGNPVSGYLGYGEINVNGASPTINGNSTISSSQGSGININSGNPTISGNTISNSLGSGIYDNGTSFITGNTVSGNQGAYGVYAANVPSAFSGNTITNNPKATAVQMPAQIGQGVVFNNSYSDNEINALILFGQISANTDWPSSNSPYVAHNIQVNAGATLAIDQGTVVKFLGQLLSGQHVNPYEQLIVKGTLNATGTTFTSLFDNVSGGQTYNDGSLTGPLSGDWQNIYFTQGGTGDLSGDIILFGGSSPTQVDRGEVFVDSSCAPTISGSTISSSSASGIYVFDSGSPMITGNKISDNLGNYGVYAASVPAAFSGNTISGNKNAKAVEMPATLGTGAVYNNTYSNNLINGMYLTGAVSANTDCESPRVSWRLHHLRGWSHEHTKEVSQGSKRTCGKNGYRPLGRVRFRVAGDAVNRRQVRHDDRDAQKLGQTTSA